MQRRVRQSTTLNRRYVKRPAGSDIVVPIRRSPKVSRFSEGQVKSPAISRVPVKASIQPSERPVAHPVQEAANTRLKARQQQTTQQPQKLTAKQLKDQAIAKALRAAERQAPTIAEQIQKEPQKTKGKIKFGVGRIVLALSCAAAAVFAIAYFVNLNMPDISFRVAAMQTGIDASYPSYLPHGFSLSGITSENGRITLNFRNTDETKTFTLIEEKSHWDTNALLANYVRPTFAEDYTVVRERGLTIYIDNDYAAWVNGGIVYKIEAVGNLLTKKQITSIATSL